MIDIEKLIERYHNLANRWENGEQLLLDGTMRIQDELRDAATALSTLQGENKQLRAELERMKKIMRDNGIMTIPPKYPGWPTEWNIPKPRGQKEG